MPIDYVLIALHIKQAIRIAYPPDKQHKVLVIDIYVLSALYGLTDPISFRAIRLFIGTTATTPMVQTIWRSINRLHKQSLLNKHISGSRYRYSITMQGTTLLHAIDHALASININKK